ncbi:uncharacterized protein LOC135943876 [Cloeon dipterum]|uniref:uncharacterized protein LOC135943876 n=1 Tax=Cloeon dipterum TaxID=197152 RepID=UPI003220449E
MTWDATWSQCCALGMQTLTIDNAEEQAGLTNLTVLLKDNWPMNSNYWTSGTWKGAPEGQWSWCESAGTSTLDQGLKWESGQPDNLGGSEQCIHFSFAMNSTQAVLTDRNCSNRYIFACKMPLIVTPKPCVVTCPKSCQRDTSLFTPDDQLINFASYGEWFNGCGRNYLFYNKMRMNWASAWETCCSFRMSMTFLDTSDRLHCISNLITSRFPPHTIGDFWLSGTGLGCDGNLHWCFLDRDFNNKDLKWKEGHPKAGLDCVYLEARNDSVLLATAACNEQKQFLCDVQKRGQSQVAKLNECLETWQVNDGELYSLMNVTYLQGTNITLRQKCFIRCIGNMFGLMGFGDVNSIALLRQIELATQGGPQKMEDGLKVQDECGGKTSDDECVTAFEVYKCGQEKAPDMVFNMVSNNFGTGPVVSPPVPCVPVWRSCWLTNSFECIPDQTAINSLNTAKNDSRGKKVTYLGKTYYVANHNPDIYLNPIDAYQHCCKIGMRLYEPQTLKDLYITKDLTNLLGDFFKDVQFIVLGDTEFINKTHEVWCGSRTLVPDDMFDPDPTERYPCTESIVTYYGDDTMTMLTDSELLDIHSYYINEKTQNFQSSHFARFICEQV